MTVSDERAGGTAASGAGGEGAVVPDVIGVPDHIAAAARVAPGHWIGLVDPAWAGDGPPPAWAVIGQWRAGEDGGVEEFAANEEYRMSPLALEWPAPTDPVDAAGQLSVTGYGPPGDVYRALASAQVAVPLDGEGGVAGIELPDGETVAVVFTARSWLAAAGGPEHAVLGVADLLERLPRGCRILVNPGAPAAMRLEQDALRELVEERVRSGGPEPSLRPFG
ncbi:type VII secretion system-associated protein [Kitasatospora sp. RG8]|uniref:type VII secretion system-associated protein n=1 Tax=Kitasatospora sp. RG8 TaxID=2820815 RepID=UPI001AE07118|nr:type VII secretion system-associated protein [Kitasatospora sp. RG8]MBP0452897.1 type VII secretion system-associated protein [Kitasatospora sp. RG8]